MSEKTIRTIRLVYGVVLSALLVMAGVLLITGCVSIYQSGPRPFTPESIAAAHMLPIATVNGARAQGREACGRIETGFRADAVLVDLHTVHNIPSYGYETTLLYSAKGADVRMTVVDGRILYRDGEYTTIDIEKLKFEAKDVIKHYFD